MALMKSSILDPASHQVTEGGMIPRNTKGTPNGPNAQFNHLPPGQLIENTPQAVDVKRDAALSPQAPLYSSSEDYKHKG